MNLREPVDLLLILPPLSQLNTPYPSAPVLLGYLQKKGYQCAQVDLSLDLSLKVFSSTGLKRIFNFLKNRVDQKQKIKEENLQFFLEAQDDYINTIDSVVAFLQNKDFSLVPLMAGRRFLPEGPRFHQAQLELSSLDLSFGALSSIDQARYLASLYLNDLYDLIRDYVDPKFGLTRYAHKISESQSDFDVILKALSEPSLIDEMIQELVRDLFGRWRPRVVGWSVPFPGNLLAAFQGAQMLKKIALSHGESLYQVMGGGYVNTELRDLTEPRVFDFVDALCFDDGELPLERILEHVVRGQAWDPLRTFFLDPEKKIIVDTLNKTPMTLSSSSTLRPTQLPHAQRPAPSYEGLNLSRYLHTADTLNPMMRLWTSGHWNKLTLAHGCYWKGCQFCDLNLDYIGRYEPAEVFALVDQVETLIQETGHRGFHFVDEALPPALLKKFAQEVLRRGLKISWWGNARFEKSFDEATCDLLAQSGCIAMTAGLEVASDRLLKLMNKGVTLAQVAQVGSNFRKYGILVHAYLMFGFPSQTTQEVVDSLEMVRQLFEQGCLDSAFWHRFSVTAHSPIGRDPAAWGLSLPSVTETGGKNIFGRNDLAFRDSVGTPLDDLQPGLVRALENYIRGVGGDRPAHKWFRPEFLAPPTTVSKGTVQDLLRRGMTAKIKS